MDHPRDYNRTFRRSLSGPLQVRVGFDREKDHITRFMLQLEYHHDGEWQPVVRYDHDVVGDSDHSHDVTDEGLHMDIYRDREKYATEYVAPPMPGAIALDRAEDHLQKNLERFIIRYQEWHGITDQ